MNYSAIETGKRIKKLRKEHGVTQEQLACLLDVTDRHIRNIEHGEKNASIDLLVELSDLFGTSLDYIILGKLTGN
ncbi:helix-turn-helix domain-containing protein [Acutalibacter intestini]|uniref:helix-turn-helix domain-containing protein n=1 Tax=Acutalibacter intestini TaxID=3093659 RepID=UPI002AC8DFDD|nr:helix-turn-helix transcriptional regulator [Acutalibacter sp. M00204]